MWSNESGRVRGRVKVHQRDAGATFDWMEAASEG